MLGARVTCRTCKGSRYRAAQICDSQEVSSLVNRLVLETETLTQDKSAAAGAHEAGGARDGLECQRRSAVAGRGACGDEEVYWRYWSRYIPGQNRMTRRIAHYESESADITNIVWQCVGPLESS